MVPKLRLLVFCSVLAATITPFALADVSGQLNIANCVGGGMTVTSFSVDFLPAGGNSGCVATGAGTNVTYTGGGPLGPGVLGSVLDLPGGGLPLANFMTFAGNPLLHFDLTSLGPGVANTACAGLGVGLSCSPFGGSPFIFTNLGGNVLFAFSASGTAGDASGNISTWTGAFTATFAQTTAFDMQTTLLGGGSLTNTQAGSFKITVNPAVPEPGSLVLLGSGLFAAIGAMRRRMR